MVGAPASRPERHRTRAMLIRHTLLYLPAQVLGPAAQLVAILLFTHAMTPAAYGLFTYVLAAQDVVFLLCLFWWSQYTVRHGGDHGGDPASEAAYHASEGAVLLGCTLAQVVAAPLTLLFVSEPVTPPLVGASVLYIVTRSTSLHLAERARARHRVLDYTLAQAAGPVAGLALAVAALSLTAATPGAAPVSALLAYGVAQAAVLAWLLPRQRVRLAPRRPDGRLVRAALAFGAPLIAAALAAWTAINAIRLLVDHAMGEAAMGLVAVGWALGLRLTSTAAMLVTAAAFPLAVRSFRAGARDEAFAAITRNGLLLLALLLPAAVGAFILRDGLVALVVAAPFRATTLAVLPAALTAGLCRNIRTHVVDQVCLLVERTPVVLAAGVGEALAVTVLCAVGLAIDGIAGAATGAAAGFAAAMVASFAWARARIGLEVPVADAARIALAVAAMAGALTLPPGGPGAGRLTVAVAVGGAAYAAAILALFPRLAAGALQRLRAKIVDQVRPSLKKS